ncbi:MAG: cupin domain-containing protein [Candidatus Cybelea sp.]
MVYRLPSPLLERVKTFGIAAGIFFAWTLVERFAIEPLGIDDYLPYYRVNGLCVWDVFALAVIVLFFARSTRVRAVFLAALFALAIYFVEVAAAEKRADTAPPPVATADMFVALKPCDVPGLRERVIAKGGNTVAYAGEFAPVAAVAWTGGAVRIYLYVVSGEGVVRVAWSVQRVHAGDFIVIPKGVRHAVNSSRGVLRAIYVEDKT